MIARKQSCATNSSYPNTGVEIFEPGLGLLLERSPRIFIFQIGQEAGICTRTVSFTGRDAARYTTILNKAGPPSRSSESEGWSLWSDLHRRIAVYETAPVAAEAQRQREFMIFDFRFERCGGGAPKSSIVNHQS
jgi:hypothetical protein